MRSKLLVSSLLGIGIIIITIFLATSCSDINTVGDSRFESDGTYKQDSSESLFSPQVPTTVKFFVEVSGSMNGFIRPNRPTQFKADVWQIFSHYSSIAPEVTILTNNGDVGASIPMSDFRTKMNTGAFVSSASTKVPLMLESIISNLNPDEGEVAVLISDMKYSPVGAAAPDVLLTQYSTDVSKILGNYGKSVSLVGATSDYLDRGGNVIADKSPYYFFVIGNGEQVASVRNDISALLEMNEHFIDNFDSGFDYGQVSCSFGIPKGCFQMDEINPTFVGLEEDTCIIKMKVDLESYRWIVSDPSIFADVFKAKPLYGSNCSFECVDIEVNNVTEDNGTKHLKRKATAMVTLKVFDLAQDSEVIEWSINLPDTEISRFAHFFGAMDENDVTKSYSVDNFIIGMIRDSVVNKKLKPSHILISKNQ